MLLLNQVNDLPETLCIHNIQAHTLRLPTGISNPLSYRVGRGLVDIAHHHVGPLLRQRLAERFADAGTSSGNKRNFGFESCHWDTSYFPLGCAAAPIG